MSIVEVGVYNMTDILSCLVLIQNYKRWQMMCLGQVMSKKDSVGLYNLWDNAVIIGSLSDKFRMGKDYHWIWSQADYTAFSALFIKK